MTDADAGPDARSVLDFWFVESGPDDWFTRSDDFDRACRDRFLATHEAAASGALDGWAAGADGALALVILLDQLPRNMFRGSPRAFATDPQARATARAAIAAGFDMAVPQARRPFFYLPLEHSEDLADQQDCVALMKERVESPVMVDYAEQHLAIIARFGRFPHRNEVLGRASTPEEIEFLKQPGSSF